MVCMEYFDIWVLMRSLKSTKRPVRRFSKMIRDLITEKTSLQISHSITDLLCPSKQIRLIAQWMTSHWSPQRASVIQFYSYYMYSKRNSTVGGKILMLWLRLLPRTEKSGNATENSV